MVYYASSEEHPLDIVNIQSLEKKVQERMDKGAFGYIAGGAETEYTLFRNTSSFDTVQILPRVLRNLAHADLETSLFGIKLPSPIIEAPSAAHGLAHDGGETFSAKGTALAGSIFSISTYATSAVEEAREAAPGAPQFFQLYMSKDDGFNRYILEKALAADAKAIILTADSTQGGYREADVINHFQFPLPMKNLAAYSSASGVGKGISEIYAAAKQDLSLEDIGKVKDMTKLPVIVKGIQAPEDADLAIKSGADGIWVSNHGGRQLDGGPGSFEVLPKIAEAAAKRVPVIFDSGIRRGEHIFKALASGADITAIGRPVIYGLNLGGAQGVKSVFDHFNKELAITMQLAGTRNIEEVKAAQLWRAGI